MRGSRGGGALVLSLMAVAAVAVMAAGLLQISGAINRRQIASLDTRRAFYLAEAGLTEAYAGLRIGKTGNVGTPEQPAAFGSGLFWVTATDVGGGRVELESTGMHGARQAILSLVAELGEESVATLGVFSSEEIVVPQGALIDAYDSTQGSLPSPDPGIAGGGAPELLLGRLGSNSDIAVNGSMDAPTVVHADLEPGPDHSVTLAQGVTHVGSTSPRDVDLPLPPVTVPFHPDQPGFKHKGPVPYVIQAGEHGLEYLRLARGAEVIVQGPCTLVLGSLEAAPSSILRFDTTAGSVSLFVLEALELAQGSQLRTSGMDPAEVTIQVPEDVPVQLRAAGSFHGVIYAPQAKMSLGPKLEVFGAAIARRLVLSAGARLHYDVHLDEIAVQDSLPSFAAWRIVELSDVPGAGSTRNPFKALGLDPSALPCPANAHADQQLHLVYEDKSGTTRTYDGPESAFDWSQVKSVSELSRDGRQVLVGTTQDPNPVAPAPGASPLEDALNGTPPTPIADLSAAMVNNTPRPSAEILAAIQHAPAFTDSEMRQILVANARLGSTELNSAIDRVPALPVPDIKEVLLTSSPLPPDVLARVLAGDVSLSPADLNDVLGAQ